MALDQKTMQCEKNAAQLHLLGYEVGASSGSDVEANWNKSRQQMVDAAKTTNVDGDKKPYLLQKKAKMDMVKEMAQSDSLMSVETLKDTVELKQKLEEKLLRAEQMIKKYEQKEVEQQRNFAKRETLLAQEGAAVERILQTWTQKMNEQFQHIDSYMADARSRLEMVKSPTTLKRLGKNASKS